MAHHEHSDSQPISKTQQRDPLTLRFYGWGSVARTALGMGVLAYLTGWSIYAIAVGQRLWVVTPFAIIFTASFLALVRSAIKNPNREGLIIDHRGIHTTLRGTRIVSFPWHTIDAAGLSYYRWSRQGRETDNPQPSLLEVFSSVPRDADIPTRGGKGYPNRVEHAKSPDYGVPDGHARIRITNTDSSTRQEIRKALEIFGGNRFINDFEQPESLNRSANMRGTDSSVDDKGFFR